MRFWSRRPPETPPTWEDLLPDPFLREQVDEVLAVDRSQVSGRSLAFGGRLRQSPDRAITILRERLAPRGYTPFLREEQGTAWVYALPIAEVTARPNSMINLVLFLATVLTTLLAGAGVPAGVPLSEFVSNPSRLLRGVPFAASLLSILLFHEFGHYALGRRHGMPVTLPYFIPAPPQIFFVGTLGAVIRLRGPVRDRRSLFDMAVAGPLAGLALAIPLCVIGLRLSSVLPIPLRAGAGDVELGESLLLKLLVWLVFGPLPAGQTVFLHPVALAAWFGFFVTVLNLMPVGQLDGGHLVYALFGRRHALISKLAVGALLAIGLGFGSVTWLVWPVLIVVMMGFHHSPPMDDITPLGARRQALGIFTLLLLLVLLPPVPLSIR
ncbi:MAG: site-2 protease family protein [Candidatus Rokuibacteriota bacterium]